MPQNPLTEDSVLGLMILNQDVLTADLYDNGLSGGVYYSKIFQKPSNHIWFQLNFLANQTYPINPNINIDIRVRTGNSLPFINQITSLRYTLDQINTLIQNNPPNILDQLIYKWQLGRGCLADGSLNPVVMNDSTLPYFQRGTTMNSSILSGPNDPVWNFWGLPFLHSSAYISNNIYHDYLQLRINLQSLDLISPADLYNITTSSVLQANADVTS